MPENSIAGFLHAQAAGVAGIETDIALTADHVPVLHHDPDLADGRLIRDVTFSELSNVPSLADALSTVRDIDWLLEIKTFPDDPAKTHSPDVMAQAVCDVLDDVGIAPGRIGILAFDWSVLAEVKSRAAALTLVCLTAPATEAARDLWWGRGFGGLTTPAAVARFGAAVWSPFHETLTAEQMAQARSLGLRVIAWTVNEPQQFARLARLVDGITTDYPTRNLRP
jgi:glycerophosphoryl diester phosphodiesterase